MLQEVTKTVVSSVVDSLNLSGARRAQCAAVAATASAAVSVAMLQLAGKEQLRRPFLQQTLHALPAPDEVTPAVGVRPSDPVRVHQVICRQHHPS